MTLQEIYDYIKNNKDRGYLKNAKLSTCRKKWFQISLVKEDKPYILSNVHFEVVMRDNRYSLEIHFEEDDTTRYFLDKQLKEIVNKNNFEWFKWWTKGAKNQKNKSLRLKQNSIKQINDPEEFRQLIEDKHKIFNDILVRIAQQGKFNKDNSQMLNIKNIILYGSPGVGKTHNTNKLIRLIENGKSDKEIFETIKSNESSDSVELSDIKERVQFVTFHQSFGYEDFIEGFRPNEEGHIKLTKGIFREICEEAQKNLEDSQKEESIISQEKIFEEIFELFKENIQDELDKKGKFVINDTAYIINIEEDAFRYQGDNWGNTQRMKYADIELLYKLNISERKEIKTVEGISGLAKQHATYFSYLMKKFFDFAQKQNIQVEEVKKVERKNYYIVIDEINRANISKVFGELITLIEEDKRDTLEVTLPYSKQSFKIPSNLYIIGTMNSTDKSIALIDIALRRRFTFLKMKPHANLIDYQPAKEIFEKLNKRIKQDLGEDYQIGHSYFMKIVNEDDLAFVLEYKIIPLLEEYYYGDDRLAEIIKICNNKEQTDEKN